MNVSSRRTWWILLVVLLALLGGVGWWIAGEVRAWRHYRAGKAALEADDLTSARVHFAKCIEAWPNSGEVRFLAARVERKSGELPLALRLLRQAAERGWVQEAIDLERSLVRVQAGELRQEEEYLIYCLENDHPDSELILEILTPAYFRNFQLVQADRLADLWLEIRPDSVKAWAIKGSIAVRRRNTDGAIAAYTAGLKLAPERHDFRRQLVEALLNRKRFPEASKELTPLLEARPDDPEVQLLHGQVLLAQGDGAGARQIAAKIGRETKPTAMGLHFQGIVELQTGKAARAEPLLRRAVALAPNNQELLYSLFQCLQRQGKTAEAEVVRKRWKASVDGLTALSEVAKKITQRPRDPELRRQAGAICLQHGQEQDGIRWLHSALKEDPNHAATHRLLADFYAKKGKKALADEHRRRATGSSGRP